MNQQQKPVWMGRPLKPRRLVVDPAPTPPVKYPGWRRARTSALLTAVICAASIAFFDPDGIPGTVLTSLSSIFFLYFLIANTVIWAKTANDAKS